MMKLASARVRSRKLHCTALIALLALLSCRAMAAMHCDGSLTQAERVICASEDLIYLDQALNDGYAATLSVVMDKAALRKAQRLWLRSERDTCGYAECMYGVLRTRIQALTSLRIAAQPVLETPLNNESAHAICTALANHVIAGKLDALLAPVDHTIVPSISDKVTEGYSVELVHGKPAVQFLKYAIGSNCTTQDILKSGSDPPPYTVFPSEDQADEAHLANGGAVDLIYFSQRYYVVNADTGHDPKSGLLVRSISPEGAFHTLCAIKPTTTQKVAVHASVPAICAVAGDLPSVNWKTAEIAQSALATADLPALDSAETAKVDLRGDGTTQTVARLRYSTSGGVCAYGSSYAALYVASNDLKEFPKNAIAKRLNQVRTLDDADIVLSRKKAYVVGWLDGHYPPGLVSLATDPPLQICGFVHETTYTVGTMFPISN